MPEPEVITEPSLVNTPPAAPAPTPESKLFASTPSGTPAPSAAPDAVVPPVVPPVIPPAAVPPAPVPDPKAPTDATKPDATKAPPTPPTDYVLTLPENSLLSAEDLAATLKEAKDAGFSKEQAEKVLTAKDQTATQTAARVKAQQDKAFADTKTAWKDAVSKDVEMGGDHLAETVALSSRAFKAVASPQLQKLADDTGLGSHPEFVRMMVKVGKLMGEDRLILGNVGDAPTPMAPEARLYGKTTPDGTGKKTG